MFDIRTQRGRLIGRIDKRANTFSIKDGGKVTMIEIPPDGLRLRFASGDGVNERVYIPPPKKT